MVYWNVWLPVGSGRSVLCEACLPVSQRIRAALSWASLIQATWGNASSRTWKLDTGIVRLRPGLIVRERRQCHDRAEVKGVNVHPGSVWRRLQGLGLTHRKSLAGA